jgi:ubiquitin carboxyl-terminal hydrolase L3
MAAPVVGSWLPVESNPDIFNAYAAKLGLDTSAVRFVDVLGTDAELLAMVPRPVLAILLLFPVTPASEAHRAAEEAARAAAPATPGAAGAFFVSQTIPQACGTIALVHAVANCSALTGAAPAPLALAPGSWFARFAAATLAASPTARCAAMAADAELEAAHGEAVQAGQSAVVDEAHEHFACFVARGGELIELDGRKEAPVSHGKTSPETLLEDAARVIGGFMARDPGELRFCMLALAPTED